jgi:hypothetical protein
MTLGISNGDLDAADYGGMNDRGRCAERHREQRNE